MSFNKNKNKQKVEWLISLFIIGAGYKKVVGWFKIHKVMDDAKTKGRVNQFYAK